MQVGPRQRSLRRNQIVQQLSELWSQVSRENIAQPDECRYMLRIEQQKILLYERKVATQYKTIPQPMLRVARFPAPKPSRMMEQPILQVHGKPFGNLRAQEAAQPCLFKPVR